MSLEETAEEKLHFTYSSAPLSTDLFQGDVLRRTPQLEEVLNEVHPHYFSKPENRFFLVLTQSCDLVRRGGEPCKARYVSIAPIRPLDVVVQRFLDEQRRSDLPPGAQLSDVQHRAQQFLERLFNNNESSFFFLRREPKRGFPDDCCAFLALSIAIKSELHYQVCVEAKLLELQEIFRAKLGWLVGNMYSRVGTEDWDKTELDKQIAALMEGVSLWIPKQSYAEVRRRLKEWKQQNGGQEPTVDVLAGILDSLPRKKDRLVERLLQLLQEQGVMPAGAAGTKLSNAVRNDPILSKLVPD